MAHLRGVQGPAASQAPGKGRALHRLARPPLVPALQPTYRTYFVLDETQIENASVSHLTICHSRLVMLHVSQCAPPPTFQAKH